MNVIIIRAKIRICINESELESQRRDQEAMEIRSDGVLGCIKIEG